MANRRGDLILLLGSLYDGLPSPAGGLRTEAGLVPSERKPCRDCGGLLLVDDFGRELRRRKGSGFIRDRFGRKVRCSSCGGVGWIAKDPMDSFNIRVGSTTTSATSRPRHRKTCDRCGGDGVWKGQRCELCNGEGRRDVHAFELHVDDEADPQDLLDRWNAAFERRDRFGSYRELDRALADLARRSYVERKLVQVVHILGEKTRDDLSPLGRQRLEAALRYVELRMPDPIRVPADVRANARERREWRKRIKGRGTSVDALKVRDKEIRAAVRRGVPVQRVAFEYDLSVSQVNRVVNGDSQ